MKNVLGTVSPVMRAVVLALRADGASGPTRAREVIRAMAKEAKSGFVVARHLDEALALAASIGERRRVRRERNEGRVASFYGPLRRGAQTAEHAAVRRDRVAFARELLRPIRMRLHDVRYGAVLRAAKASMKHGASGGTDFTIHVSATPDYHVEVTKDWSRVNRGRDTWASNVDDHTITVSPRWLGAHRRIGDGDGTVCGQMLLDAKVFVESGERVVWEARLARTGRGFSAVVEDRWLSCYGRTVTIHRNLKKALAAPPPVEYARPPSPEDEAALASLAAA